MQKLANILLIGSLALTAAACELVVPNPNQPDLQGTIDNPTPTTIAALAQGSLVRSRASAVGGQNGYISQLGVLGRESYILDNADPRATEQLLAAGEGGGTTLNPGDGAFGGNHWTVPYLALQFNELFLEVVNSPATADLLSAEEIQALIGWAKFNQAYSLTTVVNTHICPAAIVDSPLCEDAGLLNYGAVLAFDQIDARDPEQITPEALNANAPIVNDADVAYGRVLALYDEAIAAFTAAGSAAFPFTVPSGFAQFGTPADMIEVVNALKARTALYNDDLALAESSLDASFIAEDDTSFADGPSEDVGVFFNFTTDSNDVTNVFGADANLLAHPSLAAAPADGGFLQFQADGTTPDARFTAKLNTIAEPVILADLQSDLRFSGLYAIQPATTPVPVIRNEELLLIKAEVLARTGDLPGATTLVNAVRTNSGALEALADFADEDAAIDAILQERLYSLLFEGGHRWMDLRRLGRTDEAPIDRANDLFNFAYPVNISEINARQPTE